MTPLTMFNSTVLVFWVTYFIPQAMRNKNRMMLWLSSAFILAAEIVLCLTWSLLPFPMNLFAAFGSFLLALLMGRVAYLFYQKYVYSEDES